MARKGKRELTWFKARNLWRKVYKGKSYYFPGGKGESDKAAYNRAVKAWHAKLAELQGQAAEQPKEPAQAPEANQSSRGITSAINAFLAEKNAERLAGEISEKRYEHIRYCLAPFDGFTKGLNKVSDINEDLLTRYRIYVLGEVGKNKIGTVTAFDWLAVLKQFLKWAWKRRKLQDMPRNLDEMTIKKKPKEIKTIPLKDLRKIYKKATDKTKLYILLACNCGYTQEEISSIQHGELQDGCLIRKRSKTGVEQCHKLWPETLRLLEEHATDPKKHKNMLLNEGSELLVANKRSDDDRFQRNDAITNAWKRAREHAKFPRTDYAYKNLRKTAATEASKIDPTIEDQFLAQRGRSIARKHYVKAHYERLYDVIDKLEKVFDLK